MASTTLHRDVVAALNVGELEVFAAGAKVDEYGAPRTRHRQGERDRIKILGEGELTKSVTVTRARLLEVGAEKIAKAGGKTVLVGPPVGAAARMTRTIIMSVISPDLRTSARCRSSASASSSRSGCSRSTASACSSRCRAWTATSCGRSCAKQSGGLLDFFNMFSGGALEHLSIFALGIMPYVSASIILQLLGMVYKPIDELRKEGEQGRRKIDQYTRYGTIVLSHLPGVRHRACTSRG